MGNTIAFERLVINAPEEPMNQRPIPSDERNSSASVLFVIPHFTSLTMNQMIALADDGRQPGVPFQLLADGSTAKPKAKIAKTKYFKRSASIRRTTASILPVSLPSGSGDFQLHQTLMQTHYVISFRYSSSTSDAKVTIHLGPNDFSTSNEVCIRHTEKSWGPFSLMKGTNIEWKSSDVGLYFSKDQFAKLNRNRVSNGQIFDLGILITSPHIEGYESISSNRTLSNSPIVAKEHKLPAQESYKHPTTIFDRVVGNLYPVSGGKSYHGIGNAIAAAPSHDLPSTAIEEPPTQPAATTVKQSSFTRPVYKIGLDIRTGKQLLPDTPEWEPNIALELTYYNIQNSQTQVTQSRRNSAQNTQEDLMRLSDGGVMLDSGVELKPPVTLTSPRDKESSISFNLQCSLQRIQHCPNDVLFIGRDIYTSNQEDDNKAEDVEANESNECVICLTDPPSVVVFPCRHNCVCMSCAEALPANGNKCPICRRLVTLLIEIKPKRETESTS